MSVYKIEGGKGNQKLIYIGSTKKDYYKRLLEHKKNYIRWKIGCSGYNSVFKLFDKFGENNCYISEICKIENEEDILMEEMFYILNRPCVNIILDTLKYIPKEKRLFLYQKQMHEENWKEK